MPVHLLQKRPKISLMCIVKSNQDYKLPKRDKANKIKVIEFKE